METKEEFWEITFEEKNELPEGFSFEDYESKDFINSKLIQDFPLRGRAVFLRIKRRRWRHKSNGTIIKRDFTFTADGSKFTSAPIRVELAQYRELAAFSQFGSELDADTKEKLAQGERIKEILKQPQYRPMSVQYQVLIIFAATNKYLLDIAVGDITRFEAEFFEFLGKIGRAHV